MTTIFDVATQTQSVIAQYVVQPLLILFLGVFFGKLIEQLIVFLARELKKDTGKVRFVARVIAWIFYIIALGLALYSLSVLSIVLWFLAGTFIVVIVASFLLSLKDFFPNILAYEKVKKKYKANSDIKTKFGEMKVVDVKLIDTHMKNAAGDDIYFPNRSVPVSRKQM